MSAVIYEPRGKAREYAALACNLYSGCSHGCKYCYGPATARKDKEVWANPTPPARKNILQQLKKDAAKLAAAKNQHEILFCFMTDPYHTGDTMITREALRIIGGYTLNATVLTKGGTRAIRDFDLLKRHNFRFGTSMTFMDDEKAAEWEPFAQSPTDRLDAICEAHSRGIRTWVSLEPVIEPEETLEIIAWLSGVVDFWKVGKLNHMKAVEARVDWAKFLEDVTGLLDGLGQNYYIKKDLLDMAGENFGKGGA